MQTWQRVWGDGAPYFAGFGGTCEHRDESVLNKYFRGNDEPKNEVINIPHQLSIIRNTNVTLWK